LLIPTIGTNSENTFRPNWILLDDAGMRAEHGVLPEIEFCQTEIEFCQTRKGDRNGRYGSPFNRDAGLPGCGMSWK
jgi:hypothetical protein